MARSSLDLTDWLVGSIDYCAEGNLIQTRAFSHNNSQLDQFISDFDQGVFYPHLILPQIYQVVPIIETNPLTVDYKYTSHYMSNYIIEFPILPISWQPQLFQLFSGIRLDPIKTLLTAHNYEQLEQPLALIPIANGEMTNQEYANSLLFAYQDLPQRIRRNQLYLDIKRQEKLVDHLFFLKQHKKLVNKLLTTGTGTTENLVEQLAQAKSNLFAIPTDLDPMQEFKLEQGKGSDVGSNDFSNDFSNSFNGGLSNSGLNNSSSYATNFNGNDIVVSDSTNNIDNTDQTANTITDKDKDTYADTDTSVENTHSHRHTSQSLPANADYVTEIIPLVPTRTKTIPSTSDASETIEVIEIITSQLPSVPKVDHSFIAPYHKQAKPYVSVPYGRVTSNHNASAWLIDNFKHIQLPIDYQPLIQLPMEQLVGNLVNIGNQVVQQLTTQQNILGNGNYHSNGQEQPASSDDLLSQLNLPDLKRQVAQDLQSNTQAQAWMQEPDLRKRAPLCLEQVFGYNKFRPLQEQIINSILSGQDTLAILATGSGKSLCYQIPALCLNGCTLVISPLLALMHDQIKQLQTYGIEAAILSGNTTYEEKQYIYQRIQQGFIKLLYISPEKITSGNTLYEIAKLPIAFIAIDEAHCVSQWGHDFRPTYLKLHLIRKQFNYTIPVLAATATARVETRQEIVRYLDLQQPQIVVGDFDRKNIFISVEEVAADKPKYKRLVNLLQNTDHVPAIVYCFTRNTVERICQQLVDDGFDATRYHAELSPTEKNQNQKDFISGKKNIMVATIAFGMGINKGDIRLVAHYDYPSSIENYYQEIGRAGRDGEKSLAVLFADQSSREWRESIIATPPSSDDNLSSSRNGQFELAKVPNLLDNVHNLKPQPSLTNNSSSNSSQSTNQNSSLNSNSSQNSSQNLNPNSSTANYKAKTTHAVAVSSNNARATEYADADLEDADSYDLVKVKLEKFHEVLNFCDTSNCRRRILLAAFNQYLDKGCNNCDNCRNRTYSQIEVHKDYKIIIGLLTVFKQYLTLEGLINLLLGKVAVESELMRAWVLANAYLDTNKIQDYDQRITKLAADTSIAGESYWRALIRQLLDLGFIKYDKKYSYLQITEQGLAQYQADTPLVLQRTPSLTKRNVYKQALTLELDYIRESVAEILDIRYDQLLPEPSLRQIVEQIPNDIYELQAIEGMTSFRLKHLGKYILGAIELYKQRLKLKDVNYKRKVRL